MNSQILLVWKLVLAMIKTEIFTVSIHLHFLTLSDIQSRLKPKNTYIKTAADTAAVIFILSEINQYLFLTLSAKAVRPSRCSLVPSSSTASP